jgi:hypothetical protein
LKIASQTKPINPICRNRGNLRTRRRMPW